jgi:hypothetical protein
MPRRVRGRSRVSHRKFPEIVQQPPLPETKRDLSGDRLLRHRGNSLRFAIVRSWSCNTSIERKRIGYFITNSGCTSTAEMRRQKCGDGIAVVLSPGPDRVLLAGAARAHPARSRRPPASNIFASGKPASQPPFSSSSAPAISRPKPSGRTGAPARRWACLRAGRDW